MADNYLEHHRMDYEAWKARREQQRKLRLRRALEAYRRALHQPEAADSDKTSEH